MPEVAETVASGAPGSLAEALQRVQEDWNKAQQMLSKLLAVQNIGAHNKGKLLETHSCPTCRRGCRDDELQAVLDLIVRISGALNMCICTYIYTAFEQSQYSQSWQALMHTSCPHQSKLCRLSLCRFGRPMELFTRNRTSKSPPFQSS